MSDIRRRTIIKHTGFASRHTVAGSRRRFHKHKHVDIIVIVIRRTVRTGYYELPKPVRWSKLLQMSSASSVRNAYRPSPVAA